MEKKKGCRYRGLVGLPQTARAKFSTNVSTVAVAAKVSAVAVAANVSAVAVGGKCPPGKWIHPGMVVH